MHVKTHSCDLVFLPTNVLLTAKLRFQEKYAQVLKGCDESTNTVNEQKSEMNYGACSFIYVSWNKSNQLVARLYVIPRKREANECMFPSLQLLFSIVFLC